jgi:LysM repeat protein
MSGKNMTDDRFRARICGPQPAKPTPGGGPRQESINIYEPDQPSFGEERATNVLWGRVVTLGVVLLLVFFLGRASGGGSSDEVDTLRDQLAAARAEIDQLESESRAPVQPSPTPSPITSPGTGAGTTPTPSPTSTAATTEQSYVVKSGDTLSRIANRFYGNAQLDNCIATANGITNASALTVGKTLKIPPRASCA